jgi:hypothetical protein
MTGGQQGIQDTRQNILPSYDLSSYFHPFSSFFSLFSLSIFPSLLFSFLYFEVKILPGGKTKPRIKEAAVRRHGMIPMLPCSWGIWVREPYTEKTK